jgi:hypothetical protein
MPYFQCQNTRFSSVNQVTLALLEQTISNPSTEGFTETFNALSDAVGDKYSGRPN